MILPYPVCYMRDYNYTKTCHIMIVKLEIFELYGNILNGYHITYNITISSLLYWRF